MRRRLKWKGGGFVWLGLLQEESWVAELSTIGEVVKSTINLPQELGLAKFSLARTDG